MAKMITDDIVTAVNEQLGQATGFSEDAITKTRTEALNYYFMRPRGDEITGRSKVISGDLSAMVEAVLSQMLDAFSTDNVVEFEPDGPEDEDQAQLESDTVSHFIMDANNGYMAFLEAIKDALLLRNGIIKVWIDERTNTETQEYTDVDPVAYAKLTEGDVDTLEYNAEAETAKLRTTTTTRTVKVESIDIADFLYTPNWKSLDLQQIPFCAERRVDSRSSLIEQGYSKTKVEELEAFNPSNPGSAARNPGKVTENLIAPDPSQDDIEYYECYILIDTDGDGISERRKIVISGKTILENIETPIVAFAAGAVLINPHRFLGISLYDKLKQIQDINTGLERALLDNANATNKSRLVVRDGVVNDDDLEDGRVNGKIRVKASHVGPLTDAVSPLVVPDISQGILANIQHNKQSRAELGGASLELASGQAQLASDAVGSQGLDRAYSVMEQMAAMMTKIIAESLIRNVYLLTHATLRLAFDQPVNIKRSGKWDSPVPSQWVERSRVNVKIGMSAGERSRKIGTLGSILDKQLTMSDQGLDGVLVNISGFHKALMDWGRAAEIDNPEQYFVDPSSDESKAELLKKQEATKRQRDQQAALMDQALGLERLRTSMDKYVQDTELQFKYWSDNLKAEVAEAKIIGEATIKLMAAKQTPEGTDDGETDKQTEAD